MVKKIFKTVTKREEIRIMWSKSGKKGLLKWDSDSSR